MSKWRQYADRHGIRMGDHFNRTIQRALRVGLQALVNHTRHASSRAAYHWVVIPGSGGGNVRPGAWAQSKFRPAFGVPPVGQPEDAGANRQAVLAEVVSREMRRSVMPTVRGRRPATSFLFSNAIPEHWDDIEGVEGRPAWADAHPGKYRSYPDHAELESAQMAAYSAMEAVWMGAFARDAVRRIPLR